MSIPASKLVNAIPGVLAPGGNPRSLNGVILTLSDRVPVGTLMGFGASDDVGNFFGFDSIEAQLAAIYFNGFTGCDTLPSVLYFMQYNDTAVGAYLRSGSFAGVTLAQLQALSGTIIAAIDGSVVTSANIDLSTATSFSNAAALIQAGLQSVGSKFVGVGTIGDGAGGAGNLLTITAVTSGSLKIGDIVAGGVNPAAITALGTGTGGIGAYTVGGAAQDFDPGGALTVASTATATYDSQLKRFLIHSPTTGVDSSIGYATGTLAAGMKFQLAQGAVLSQGAAVATPATFMPTVTAASQNWFDFMTAFEPNVDTMLDFATWVQGQNQRFGYVAWTSDITILQGAAPASFPAQAKAADMVGIMPLYDPADDTGNGRLAAFVMGCAGSTDFDQPAGRITYAFRGQSGMTPHILDATSYENMKANGCNGYCDFATGADLFVNLQPGSTPGPWNFWDSYVNQVWLNSNIQLALIVYMTQKKQIPYNTEGYNEIRNTMSDPINRAKASGVIQPGITLSNSQRAQINSAAGGIDAASALTQNGFFLLILDAPPEVRVVRGSPPMTLWYTDGGSIQFIEFASINVQ